MDQRNQEQSKNNHYQKLANTWSHFAVCGAIKLMRIDLESIQSNWIRNSKWRMICAQIPCRPTFNRIHFNEIGPQWEHFFYPFLLPLSALLSSSPLHRKMGRLTNERLSGRAIRLDNCSRVSMITCWQPNSSMKTNEIITFNRRQR